MSYKCLITYKFGDDYVQSGDEMLYHCPFCPELGKRNNDRKLYVNSKNGKYHCFRCDTVGNFNGKIETTMEYITTNSSSLKSNHKNCVI